LEDALWPANDPLCTLAQMLDLQALKAQDLQGLSPEAMARAAEQMLAQLLAQSEQIARQDREIRFKDARLEKVMFELARLKAWKFGARTEAMNAEQRRLFEETMAEDEASLQSQLEELQARRPAHEGDDASDTGDAGEKRRRHPKRQALPAHLRRVDHVHEPADTNCPSPDCGRPMVRVGEDVSERLDIVPAEFFVHRHIYGKWACRCCQCLVQEAAVPHIIDGGIPAAGLLAHTAISRFVDHLPYYRQQAINARSGVHTPHSTLAQWSGRTGAALEPLWEAHRRFVLTSGVLHADETPVAMLDPGRGKTRRAYVWAYARGAFDSVPGVIYEFCLGRGAQYPIAFLQGSNEEGLDRYPAPHLSRVYRTTLKKTHPQGEPVSLLSSRIQGNVNDS
jgi:transposase